jgi:peptidoglycan/xylan/chitin deacetylase (PgdA/CDA1 family)
MKKQFVLSWILAISVACQGSTVFAQNAANSNGVAQSQNAEEGETPTDEELLEDAAKEAKGDETHFSQIVIEHEISPQDYIPVLMYHHFEKGDVAPGNGAIVSIDEFEDHIITFQEAGYTLISLEELYKIMEESTLKKETEGRKPIETPEFKLDKKYLCITIDDGYRSNYELAFPILQKYQAKADISVITSRIHGSYIIAQEIEKLCWKDLNVMQESGLVNIYNHTSNHVKVSEKPLPSFRNAVEQGETMLNKYLTKRSNIQVLTYPNGDYTFASQILMRKLGYDLQLTTNFGVVNRNTSVSEIPRVTVDSGLTGEQVLQKITAAAQRTFYPSEAKR